MFPRTVRPLAGVAGALIAALVVAACGGSAGVPAPTPSGSPITLGIGVAKTGFTGSSSGPTAEVADAWTKWTNAHGGIGGHPVVTLVADTAGTPVTAQAVMKQFVEHDKVAAVVLVDAASEGAVAPYLQQTNTPVVGGIGFSPAVWGKLPNFFSITGNSSEQQREYTVGATAIHGTTIGTAVCAEVASCSATSGVVAREAARLGMKFGGEAKLTSSAPGYTAECLNYIAAGVDVIAAGITNTVLQRLISDCSQQGYTGGYSAVSGSVIQTDMDTVTGVRFGGTIPTFPWWIDNPAVNAYRDAMAQYAPSTDIRSTYNTSMWTSLELFKKAVSGSPDALDPAKVSDAYYALRNETLDGLLPQPLNFGAGQPAPLITCFWPYTYTAGDDHPTIVQLGRSGNGATGELSSSCLT